MHQARSLLTLEREVPVANDPRYVTLRNGPDEVVADERPNVTVADDRPQMIQSDLDRRTASLVVDVAIEDRAHLGAVAGREEAPDVDRVLRPHPIPAVRIPLTDPLAELVSLGTQQTGVTPRLA